MIAAVASDLIPEVEKIGTPAGILSGFAAGGLFMIGLKWLVLKFEKKEQKNKKLPVGLSQVGFVLIGVTSWIADFAAAENTIHEITQITLNG